MKATDFTTMSDKLHPFDVTRLRLEHKALAEENQKLVKQDNAYRQQLSDLGDKVGRLRATVHRFQKRNDEIRRFGLEQPNDDRVAQEFARRFGKRVSTWDEDACWYMRYDPTKDSRAFTIRRQHEFKVTYSVATVNGYDTAIASYWIKEQGKPRFVHFDIPSLLDPILRYYELKYYDPKTGEEKYVEE